MKFDIIETEFRRSDTSAYQLSILLGMDSLVYSIYETKENQLLLLKNCVYTGNTADPDYLKSSLTKILEQEDVLNTLYRRVKIGFPQGDLALVPSRLYNEREKSTYLQMLKNVNGNIEIKADEIHSQRINIVYAVDTQMKGLLKKTFPTAHFFNAATPYIEGCSKMVSEETGKSVFADFEASVFKLTVFEKKNLLFYNSFAFHSADDVMYFILLTFEQLGLDPEVDTLLLSGRITEGADIHKLLYRYITHISFLPDPGFVKFGRSASSLENGYFFNLHSLLLCK